MSIDPDLLEFLFILASWAGMMLLGRLVVRRGGIRHLLPGCKPTAAPTRTGPVSSGYGIGVSVPDAGTRVLEASEKPTFVEEMRQYLDSWGPVDVREVEPLLVSYRPTRFKSPPLLHQELLSENPDPMQLFPDAPNRQAVLYNFRASLCGFEKAFQSYAKDASGHRLTGWRDLLRLNLRHATEACRHFTNGQRTVTVLALEGGRCSVALHNDMEEFLTEYARSPSLIAGNIATVLTEIEAEALARNWLSRFDERMIAVRIRGKPATMHWRTWGRARGADGDHRQGPVLTLAGRRIWSGIADRFGSDPYAVLNRLSTAFPGVEADTCATCLSFKFSGMSWDMSGGWMGYCMHPDRASFPDARHPITSVLERCENHAFVRDVDRPRRHFRK